MDVPLVPGLSFLARSTGVNSGSPINESQSQRDKDHSRDVSDAQVSILSPLVESVATDTLSPGIVSATEDRQVLSPQLEEMRARVAQAKIAKPVAVESVSPNLSSPANALTGEVRASSGVNFSILEQAFSNHGFQEIEDSEEDEEGQIQNETQLSDLDHDTSSDSLSQEESSSDEDEPMTQAERERMLRAADGEDDVDFGNSNEIPRTKNEIKEEEAPIHKPDFSISFTDQIVPLGQVTNIVDKAVVITGASNEGESRVLDIDSLLVFEDRKNLGYIADTFGPVVLPMFTVRFASIEEMKEVGVEIGRMVYSVPQHSNYVFRDTLKIKGSDASNWHDEEVNDAEVEFSDDEEEQEYKRMLKQEKEKRKRTKDGKILGDDYRNRRPLSDLEAIAASQGLSYNPAEQRVRPQYNVSKPLQQMPVQTHHNMTYQQETLNPQPDRGSYVRSNYDPNNTTPQSMSQAYSNPDHLCTMAPLSSRGLYQPNQRPL